MKKEQLKPYFEAHPTETELYILGTQVYLGSQKVHAQNYATSQKLKLEDHCHTRADVMGTKIPK